MVPLDRRQNFLHFLFPGPCAYLASFWSYGGKTKFQKTKVGCHGNVQWKFENWELPLLGGQITNTDWVGMAKYLLQQWNGHFENAFFRQIHLHPTNQSDQCQGLTTTNVLCLIYVCDAGPIAIDSMLITAVYHTIDISNFMLISVVFYAPYKMVMVDMDGSCLPAASQPKLFGLVWGLEAAATRRSVCIHQMIWKNSHNGFGHHVIRVNIVEVLLLNIIYIYQ